jgi:hypothetical protein
MIRVECVCGCGTEIPKRLMPTNLVASMLLLELAEWDRSRYQMAQAGGEDFNADSLEDFIEDGALCYQRSLAVLHGYALHSTPRDTNKWMKYSRKSRKKLSKRWGVISGEKQVPLDDEHLANLNREYPERSYTGRPVKDEGDFDPEVEAKLPELEDSDADELTDEDDGGSPDRITPSELDRLERKYGAD